MQPPFHQRRSNIVANEAFATTVPDLSKKPESIFKNGDISYGKQNRYSIGSIEEYS
jgi:hypothetical protein